MSPVRRFGGKPERDILENRMRFDPIRVTEAMDGIGTEIGERVEKVDGPKPSYIKKALGNMAFQQLIRSGR